MPCHTLISGFIGNQGKFFICVTLVSLISIEWGTWERTYISNLTAGFAWLSWKIISPQYQFIFDRWSHSSSVLTLDKYEYDPRNSTDITTKSKFPLKEKSRNAGLVTLTPVPLSLTAPEEENSSGHVVEIAGKKVKGIGLGNIFGGGPIKLRSTSDRGKKPPDEVVSPRAENPPVPKEEVNHSPAKEPSPEAPPVNTHPIRVSPMLTAWQNFFHSWTLKHHIDGLVQERCNSSAFALKLRLFCTNPLTCCWD